MTNIVERLRHEQANVRPGAGGRLAGEAADEIERLTAILAEHEELFDKLPRLRDALAGEEK